VIGGRRLRLRDRLRSSSFIQAGFKGGWRGLPASFVDSGLIRQSVTNIGRPAAIDLLTALAGETSGLDSRLTPNHHPRANLRGFASDWSPGRASQRNRGLTCCQQPGRVVCDIQGHGEGFGFTRVKCLSWADAIEGQIGQPSKSPAGSDGPERRDFCPRMPKNAAGAADRGDAAAPCAACAAEATLGLGLGSESVIQGLDLLEGDWPALGGSPCGVATKKPTLQGV